MRSSTAMYAITSPVVFFLKFLYSFTLNDLQISLNIILTPSYAINEKYNITIVVVDSTNGETYPSFWDGRFLADRVQQYILGRRGPKTETLVQEENYTIEKSFDKHAKSFYLQNWGFFEDNKTIFIMSMPIASIHESVDLSNRFMVYIGLIALAAGSGLLIYILAAIIMPRRPLD